MKQLMITLTLILPALASAQNFQNMSEADIQRMQQQMQQVQACMADVDMAELKKFEQRAYQMESRVKALCASGKRDAAEKEAISFGKEVNNTEAMKKMQECGKLMDGAIPGMPTMHQSAARKVDNRHICDN